MTAVDRALLIAPPNTEQTFSDAVDALFKAPKNFATRHLSRFSVPVFSVTIATVNLKMFLLTFKFPGTFNNRIYYDAATANLSFVGVMTELERSLLLKLSQANDYTTAIQALFDAPAHVAPQGADIFLTGAVASTLFDGTINTPQERFLLVLEKLLPYLQVTLSEIAVKQRLGEYLKLDATMIDGLVMQWIKPQKPDPLHPTRMTIADFLDPAFSASNQNIPSSKDSFPNQFNSIVLLSKVAFLVRKFEITTGQLRWLFDPKLNANWLDFNALPLGTTVPTNSLFQDWERLADLMLLRDALPHSEALLEDIFTTATPPGAQLDEVLKVLSKGTQWQLSSLESLSGATGFGLSVGDFAGGTAISRLASAIKMLRRLGASADQCLSWMKSAPTGDAARQLKSLVRAKYDEAQWLETAKVLRDPLRERQRSASVAYLIQQYGLQDSDDLHDRLLIDVEMSPCMMTTRIKQAISSVQLFVQRCLMNLEQDVLLTHDEAREWSQWRKWYRVWEVNCKVLLYTENWIDPELRDDKSPFFEQLENELLQSDVTLDTAEDALQHYLEKLDQVARLEIVGLYREQEPEDTIELLKAVDILHVFGRAYTVPHYYFSRRLEGGVWSAWRSIDLDIEGDHLIPVVWNRRLYLFWALFTEKTVQPTKEQRAANQDPNMYWEIRLAWSQFKNERWSAKITSKQYLRQNEYPFLPEDVPQDPPLSVSQEPQDFSFKTRVGRNAEGDEQLSIECYGNIVREDLQDPPPPPGPRPAVNQVLGPLGPYEIFDILKGKDVEQPTYLRVRFLLGNDKLNGTERAHTTLEIRDLANQVLESIPLKFSGVVYSMTAYSTVVFYYLVSEDYEVDSIRDDGSWPPFDPVAYATALVESCFDAIADAIDIDIGRTTVNIAIAAATATALATAGVTAFNMVAVATAVSGTVLASVTAVVAGIAVTGKVNVPTIVAHAAIRWFGRGVTVKLKARAPAPVVKPPERVFKPTVESMSGIGIFTMDDCHGDLVALQTTEVVQSMTPTSLIPYPNTSIQHMQLVETEGEHAFVTLPPRRGDAILNRTPGTFCLLAPHQDAQFSFESPFFFQDSYGTYFVSFMDTVPFSTHFHPTIGGLIKELNRKGIHGMLTLENQQQLDNGAAFWGRYLPEPLYVAYATAPKENVDFGYDGAYSLYNWELFFHAPFLIAISLSKNQRFEEAQQWFHYIFDPTAAVAPDNPLNPGPQRFWRVRPFYDEAARGVQTLEALLKDAGTIDKQIDAWEADPFKPHVIARLRVVAYMKAIVMRYIDNLFAWADQLFRQDTIESINEATQLYILAARILGWRPERIPARAKAKVQTFRTLDDLGPLDRLSNAIVQIEAFLAPSVAPVSSTADQNVPTMRYFCMTSNDKLLSYWDTVADRLFKIRHCMNIEGIERSLPIFDSPIDPGLLVRATAAGIDLASALDDINAAIPHYRFNVMAQKATELCNDVKTLGGAFLTALEKRDAEELALLRSSHEVALLQAIRDVKAQQVNEASDTLAGLMKYQDVVTARQQYYLTRPFMNPLEIGHIALAGSSLIPMSAQLGAEVSAAVGHLIPDAKLGFFTTVGTTYGGSNIAGAVQAFGSPMGVTASILNTAASLSATLGGYQRRQDDWTHQADLATKELKQVEKQIAAAEIRLAIADHELENHDLQIDNAKEVDEYMRDKKFTNQALYGWHVGRLSGVFFQSYQLAYDFTKRVERAYRHELGLSDSDFIQFGYWDSLKKGLLSGERLYLDLKRMEVAYLDQNKREYEITKHISLIMIDPLSLVKLKETGECFINLPEPLFDLDYPGH